MRRGERGTIRRPRAAWRTISHSVSGCSLYRRAELYTIPRRTFPPAHKPAISSWCGGYVVRVRRSCNGAASYQVRNRRRVPRHRIYERARRAIPTKRNGINGAADAGNSVWFADLDVPAARAPAIRHSARRTAAKWDKNDQERKKKLRDTFFLPSNDASNAFRIKFTHRGSKKKSSRYSIYTIYKQRSV